MQYTSKEVLSPKMAEALYGRVLNALVENTLRWITGNCTLRSASLDELLLDHVGTGATRVEGFARSSQIYYAVTGPYGRSELELGPAPAVDLTPFTVDIPQTKI